MKRTLGCIVVSALALVSCTDSSDDGDGVGAVSFTTWGEEYIEREIPATSPEGEVIVEDGWTVKFTKFLIVLAEVNVAEDDKPPVARLEAPILFDMHTEGVKEVATFASLPAKAYSHVSYAIAPATNLLDVDRSATEADKTLMLDNGFSLFAEGTVTKGAETKRFAWGFKTSTLYDRCKGELAGKETDGVVVTNGGNDTVELTIHGDHLFYDDLQSPDAKVRVDSIALADANADGEITLEELAAVQLADRTKIAAGPYGTGSAAGINDLRAFVEALSRTVGHYRGEGECLTRAR